MFFLFFLVLVFYFLFFNTVLTLKFVEALKASVLYIYIYRERERDYIFLFFSFFLGGARHIPLSHVKKTHPLFIIFFITSVFCFSSQSPSL